VKLQEQEFFASRSVEIATAENSSVRKKLIAKLPSENPSLWKAWCEASRVAEGQSHFVRNSARYPLCGKGDVNTYALFAEHNRSSLNSVGRAGFMVPTGIVSDDSTKHFLQMIVETRGLVSFYDFENREALFASVHRSFKFGLLTLGAAPSADFVFFASNVAHLNDADRHFTLSPADFATLNPNTKTCPTFRSKRDAELNLAIYRRAGVLWREDDEKHGNPWGLRFMAMLHMANDSGLFRSRAQLEAAGAKLVGNHFKQEEVEYVPLIEAKMVHHFDHRFGTYGTNDNQEKTSELGDSEHAQCSRTGLPYYWVEAKELLKRIAGVWDHQWLLGWRDITGTLNQRTLVASLIPLAATGDTFLLAMPQSGSSAIDLYCSLTSFVVDYAARQKVGGTHLKYHVFKQLPILPTETFAQLARWAATSMSAWIRPRVLELTYTAWDIEPFAQDAGYDGPPFKWDPARRFLLRCELDAAFFHLYGISYDDAAYILDTFPIVKKNDEKANGEYRTKRVILEIYDAMAAASKSGKPYQTLLSPPPADPSVAHPDTRRVKR